MTALIVSENDEVTTKMQTLHEMRQQSGKTGRTICRIGHTTYQSLRNWETGTNIPDVVTVDTLLRIYDKSYYDLDLELYRKGLRVMMNRKSYPTSDVSKTYTLLEMRQKAKMSGELAANLSNITYRTLRNWETGANIPDIVSVDDLLNVYGYSFYELDIAPFRKIRDDQIQRYKENEV